MSVPLMLDACLANSRLKHACVPGQRCLSFEACKHTRQPIRATAMARTSTYGSWSREHHCRCHAISVLCPWPSQAAQLTGCSATLGKACSCSSGSSELVGVPSCLTGFALLGEKSSLFVSPEAEGRGERASPFLARGNPAEISCLSKLGQMIQLAASSQMQMQLRI